MRYDMQTNAGDAILLIALHSGGHCLNTAQQSEWENLTLSFLGKMAG